MATIAYLTEMEEDCRPGRDLEVPIPHSCTIHCHTDANEIHRLNSVNIAIRHCVVLKNQILNRVV